MTAPTLPAVSEVEDEAVAPSVSALKVAKNEGGAAGVLSERIAWALDPEAFQIWEREHEAKPKGSGPTWDQLAVHGRRSNARATAARLVSGPIASEIARLTGERDAAIELMRRARESITVSSQALDLAKAAMLQDEATIEAAEAETARLRAALEPFVRYAEHCPGIDDGEGEIGEYYHDGLRVSIRLADLRAALSSQEETA